MLTLAFYEMSCERRKGAALWRLTNPPIELSDMIVGLRKELQEAQKKAEKENLKFKVESIEVEAQVTVTKEVGAEGVAKWKFLIFSEIEAKATGSLSKETVQTIRLTMTPEHADGGATYIADEAKRPE